MTLAGRCAGATLDRRLSHWAVSPVQSVASVGRHFPVPALADSRTHCFCSRSRTPSHAPILQAVAKIQRVQDQAYSSLRSTVARISPYTREALLRVSSVPYQYRIPNLILRPISNSCAFLHQSWSTLASHSLLTDRTHSHNYTQDISPSRSLSPLSHHGLQQNYHSHTLQRPLRTRQWISKGLRPDLQQDISPA